jgi:hypothetical protein
MLDMYKVYGKNPTDLPGKRVVNVLSKRLDFLVEKLKSIYAENEGEGNKSFPYIVAEIRALKKSINFFQWIKDNYEDETVDNFVKKYKNKDNSEVV